MSLPKQKRATWTEDSLAAAVRAIRNGLSTYKASEQYGIPRRTLRNHVQKGNLMKRLGRHTIFTPDQEKDFVRRIIRFSDLGIPMTPKMIRIQAFAFCQKFDIPHSFNKESGIAGKGWLRLFLKRNPELAKRKAQFLNPARAQKLNKPIVSKHFQEVRKLYDELSLHDHPERIFNMDEKGCRLTLHHQQKVISQKGAKRVHMQVAEHGENVTVVGCANAFGNPIPPMVLFKGKRKKPEFDENLPPGSVVHMAAKGSMTTELFVVFIQHLAKFKPFGKCLLIFDGAKSHLDFRIVEEADKHDIVLYCLPSNTTHELQPMDKSCFKPFESYWDQEVLKFLYENRAKTISKRHFNEILTRVWLKCMTPANITSGFRATGLYPLNPNAIPESAFAPSVLTDRSNTNTSNFTMLNNNEEFIEPSPNMPQRSHSDTATDTDNDSRSSSPIATLQELRHLISTESLPTTPITPDIHVLQNCSSACHSPTSILNITHQEPGTSGLFNTRPLVDYSDTDEDILLENKIIKKIINKPVQVRSFRIYSSSDSDTDSANDGSKMKGISQYSGKNLTMEISRNVPDLHNKVVNLVNANSKKNYQPQVLPANHYLSPTTSQKNMVQDQTSSEEDNIPLALLSSKSDFQKFMPTPDYGEIKTRPRRKALNYIGQRVTKDLFNRKDTGDKEKTKTLGSKKKTKAVRKPTNYKRTQNKKSKKAEKEESWYCHACQKDEVADMRPCKDCFKWYHEDCIGITKYDFEAFVCPDCDKN